MLARYLTPEMSQIWSSESVSRVWASIQKAVVEAQDLNGSLDGSIEAEPFSATADEELFGQLFTSKPACLRAFLTLQLRRTSAILVAEISDLISRIRSLAKLHQNTLCIGRTHGVHAEPTTFGIKLLGHSAEFERCLQRLKVAGSELDFCGLFHLGTSGPRGIEWEIRAAQQLNLQPDFLLNGVLSDDRSATYFSAVSITAAAIERLALEFRHLQRSEILETEETFGESQMGSSAMPHKRNPVQFESLCGLSRQIKSAVLPQLENHARSALDVISLTDIDAAVAGTPSVYCHFALRRLKQLVNDLRVYPARMRSNLDLLGGLAHSHTVFLELIKAGMPHNDAYRCLQRMSFTILEMPTPRPPDAFKQSLQSNPLIVSYLSHEQITACFDLRRYESIAHEVFKRAAIDE